MVTMGNGHTGRPTILFIVLLTLTAALAGCAGPTTDEPGGTGSSELSAAEARQAYASALKVLEEGASEVDRVGLSMAFEALSGDEQGTGQVDGLFDEAQQLAIMSMSGSIFDEGGDMPVGPGGETFLFGQVAKTSFFGAPPSLIGMYNESAEPVEGFTAVDSTPESGVESGEGSLFDPTTFLGALESELPDDAEVSYAVVQHEGQAAIEINVTYAEDDASFDVRVVILEATELPALIETTFTDPNATDPSERDGRVTMAFTYDEQATHEHEEALVRLETMTLLDENAVDPFGMGAQEDDGRFSNATIQPSINPGLIPLDELEIHIDADTGAPGMDGQETGAVLTMGAEEGVRENDQVRVSYEDVDEDGHVSPGDRIILEDLNTTDGERYALVLHDEVTGFNLVPGVTAWLAMALLAGVAVARRNRS